MRIQPLRQSQYSLKGISRVSVDNIKILTENLSIYASQLLALLILIDLKRHFTLKIHNYL
jgi:hypothetical protein